MPPFRKTELTYMDANGQQQSRLDWYLMNFGPIALFHKAEVLADTIVWLEQHDYTVAQAECAACASEEQVLWAIGLALGFPHRPYPSLDGFADDCHHLEAPEEGGLTVVLRRFEVVHSRFPEFARQILDIFAWAVWNNLLYGRRLLCLVQSEGPRIQLGRVGGREPWWNPRE
jgi:hypothetical protein